VVGNDITCFQPLNRGFLPSRRSSRINTSAAFPMSRYIQNHPSSKQFQPNWKMEMSELLCAFYCQMTVRLPLHLSRSKPCRRNIHLLLSLCPTYLDLMFSSLSVDEATKSYGDCLEVKREYYLNCFIYCQRATSSMGTVNRNSSHSPVGP